MSKRLDREVQRVFTECMAELPPGAANLKVAATDLRRRIIETFSKMPKPDRFIDLVELRGGARQNMDGTWETVLTIIQKGFDTSEEGLKRHLWDESLRVENEHLLKVGQKSQKANTIERLSTARRAILVRIEFNKRRQAGERSYDIQDDLAMKYSVSTRQIRRYLEMTRFL